MHKPIVLQLFIALIVSCSSSSSIPRFDCANFRPSLMDIFYRTQLENDIILADDIVPEAMPAANSRGERARDRMLLVLSKAANSNAMDFSEMASDYCIAHCKPFIASTISPDEAECMKICHNKFVSARRVISRQIMNTVGYNAYLVRSSIVNESQHIKNEQDKYPWEQYQMGMRQRLPSNADFSDSNSPVQDVFINHGFHQDAFK